jgi:putative heme-binding domain-containing protein
MRVPLFFLAAATLLAQHGYSPADIEEGGRLYRASCVVCHGPDGDALPNVDLGHAKFRRASTDEEAVQIILKGIPGTSMPPNAFLNEFQAGAIVAYLHDAASGPARKSALSGDAARGKTLFESRGCRNCHRVQGNGSRLGPELTDIGAQRRAVEIERSILDPDAEIVPQNRFIRVVTRDGTTITGRLLNVDTFTIQMLDSSERLVSFAKSNLRDYAVLEKSPMPSYRDRLNPQELADLVAYLASRKGIDKQ